MIIQNCFYSKEIMKEINFQISDGKYSFNELSDAVKNTLISYCITSIGDAAYECIIESENFSKTLKLFKNYLLKGNQSNALDLAEVMQENAHDYFLPIINGLFDEIVNDLHYDTMITAGFHPQHHKDNNEVYWVKP